MSPDVQVPIGDRDLRLATYQVSIGYLQKPLLLTHLTMTLTPFESILACGTKNSLFISTSSLLVSNL